MCLVVRYIQILNDIRGVNDEDIRIFGVERYAYDTLCASVSRAYYDDVWSNH